MNLNPCELFKRIKLKKKKKGSYRSKPSVMSQKALWNTAGGMRHCDVPAAAESLNGNAQRVTTISRVVSSVQSRFLLWSRLILSQ